MDASITLKSASVEKVDATEGTTALAFGGVTLGGKPAGLAGTVEAVDAEGTELTLACSKLDGEQEWTVDGLFIGSRCAYANGYGARYLRTKQLTSAELIAALDAEAAAVTA